MAHEIIQYLEWLNATRFLFCPIGIDEAKRFVIQYGDSGYLHLLKRWYNEHFHYDQETL